MEYLKDDCIFKLIKESEKRYNEANDERDREKEDAYQEALYDVLDWVNGNKSPVEVIGGELEMVAI